MKSSGKSKKRSLSTILEEKIASYVLSAEKYHILMEEDKRSLNVRSELLSKCRHRARWKLDKIVL